MKGKIKKEKIKEFKEKMNLGTIEALQDVLSDPELNEQLFLLCKEMGKIDSYDIARDTYG